MTKYENQFLVSENMIMWAFRYALGRRTGAVTDVVDHLKENWWKLKLFTQDQIKDEIKRAIELETAGDNCDVVSWQEILELENKNG